MSRYGFHFSGVLPTATHYSTCEACGVVAPLYGHHFVSVTGGLTVARCYRALCPGCLLAAQTADERKAVPA